MANPEEKSIFVEDVPEYFTLAEVLEMAMRLHQTNRFEQAEEIYRRVLEQAPENPDVLHFLGLLRHQRGYWQDAVELINQALFLAPDYLDALNNLGNIHLQTGQAELAEHAFRRVIELNPGFAPAYGNLGVALKEVERYDEAVVVLMKAISLDAEGAHYYQNLGNVLRKKGDYEDAISYYRQALSLKPCDSETYKNLCRTFYLLGQMDAAVDILDRWLEFDPADPTAQHMRSAYSGENTPERASDAFIRDTFDDFADSFDFVLKRLEYKAPFLVEKALKNAYSDPVRIDLLDVGCGTGLCGVLLRPMARRLTGIDLSSRMLGRARAREIYDALFEAELTDFLSHVQGAYDAAVCADTLCYFGNLAPPFQAAMKALRPGGWFVFTLEKLDGSESPRDFRLNPHGRYSHAKTYLERSLRCAGFVPDALDDVVLRMEFSKPVHGFIVAARVPQFFMGGGTAK